MFVDRVYPLLKEKRGGFQRLYIADGNTLPFYKTTKNKGKLDLTEGTYKVKIVADDYFGNSSEATLRLHVNSVENSSEDFVHNSDSSSSDSARLNAGNWTWFENWVNIPDDDIAELTVAELSEDESSGNYTIYNNRNGMRLKLNPARDIFFRTAYDDHFIARQVTPEHFSIVPSTTDKSFAAFQPETFYDTLSVAVRVRKFKNDSTLVEVHPSNQPIKRAYKLAVDIDSTQRVNPKLGLYNYEPRRGKFSYLNTKQQGEYLVAYPEELGSFYILKDDEAPELTNPRIVKRVDGQWMVYVTMRDNLSGIDYKRSIFRVNGTRGIAEYEPEDNRLVYYHPEFKPVAENELEITVYDMEDNKTERSISLPFESGN